MSAVEVFDSVKFYEIMGRFAHARSVLKVCHGSLTTSESADVVDEADVLAEAIEKFREIYNEFDLLAMALPPPSRRPKKAA